MGRSYASQITYQAIFVYNFELKNQLIDYTDLVFLYIMLHIIAYNDQNV